MNDFIKKHVWFIVASAFTLGGIWAVLQTQVTHNTKDIDDLKTETKEHHDFIVAQKGVNETVNKIDRKLDRILQKAVVVIKKDKEEGD